MKDNNFKVSQEHIKEAPLRGLRLIFTCRLFPNIIGENTSYLELFSEFKKRVFKGLIQNFESNLKMSTLPKIIKN